MRPAGYSIGLGTIESGCKQIASFGLKPAFARWTFVGSAQTAKVRATWLSGDWDSLEIQTHDFPPGRLTTCESPHQLWSRLVDNP